MSTFFSVDVLVAVGIIALIAIGTLLGMVLVRLFLILGTVEKITHGVAEESERLKRDMADLRQKVWNAGVRIADVYTMFTALLARFVGGTGKRKKKTLSDS